MGPIDTPLEIALGLTALLGAILYILTIHKLPYKGDFALKSLPIFIMAGFAFALVPGTAGQLLGFGLVLSAGGDISLSFKGEKFFLMGLSFFLLAHVLYVASFSMDYSYRPDSLPWMVLMGVFGLGMGIVLVPRLGKMLLPVMVYMSVILVMGIFAAMWNGPNPLLLVIGAFIFMLSDAMIAIDRFVKPISWSRYFIMTTYYVGQGMILWAHF